MINSAAARAKVAQRGFAVSIATPTGNKTQGESRSRYFVWRIPIKAITTSKTAL